MMQVLNAIIANKGHTVGYGLLTAMILAAYLTQGERINTLSLELGELRSTDKYQTLVIEHLTESLDQCQNTNR